MFRKYALPEPTREERIAKADALSSDALGLFDRAALQLENAALEQTDLADEVHAEAESLRDQAIALDGQRDELDLAAAQNAEAAGRIRSLFA